MPARYRQLFRGAAADEHAGVAARRDGAPAHAEIWRRLPSGGAIACIVAEDRPGLLSYVGSVLTTRSIDIVSAQVYARANPRGAEVVDLFWLRREEGAAAPIVDTDLSRVADLLAGLMTGELRMDGRPLGARHVPTPHSATLLHFEEVPERGPATLCLETEERPGLFRAVTSALQAASVRVTASRQASGDGARVMHRFSLAEEDGRAPDPYRRGELQAEVLCVVEAATRTGSARTSARTGVSGVYDRVTASELRDAAPPSSR